MARVPSLLLTLGAALAAPFVCPTPARPVRAPFLGVLTDGPTTYVVTPTTVFATTAPDTIDSFRCVANAFVSPVSKTQLFLTYGNARNAPGSVDVGCAALAVPGSGSGTGVWAEALNETVCPLGVGGKSLPWTPGAPPATPGCPPSGAPIPSSVTGVANLTDADGSGDSFYLITAAAWSTVVEGSLVDVLCPASVGPAPGASGATQIAFANAAGSGPPARAACVWVAASGRTLSYKWGGAGVACPTDFTGAAVAPFTPQ